MFNKDLYKKYIFVIPFSILVIFRLINLNFPFGDFDEGVYIASARSVVHGFPLIEKTYNSQFPLFVDILSWLYRIHPSIWFMRLFPVACSILAIGSVYIILRKFTDNITAILIVLYLGLNGIFLSVSRTIQADMPWVGFTSLSFLMLLLFDRERKRIYLLLSAIAFIISVLIKANPIFIPVLVVYLVYIFHESPKKALEFLFEFILICAIVFLIVVPFKDISLLYTQSVTIRTGFLGQPINILNSLNSPTRILLIKHEIGIIFLSILSIVFLFKVGLNAYVKNRYVVLVTTWFIATCFVMSVYNPLFTHHIVFFILPATLQASFILSYFIKQGGYIKGISIIIFLLIILYGAMYGIQDTNILFPQINQYDQQIKETAKYVDEHTGKNDYVITDEEIIQYLANRDTPPNEVDTSYVRIVNRKLTSNQLILDTKTFNVASVVFISGRLDQLPEYRKFLEVNYNSHDIGSAVIFTRK